MSFLSGLISDIVHDLLWLGNSLQNPGHVAYFNVRERPSSHEKRAPLNVHNASIPSLTEESNIVRICVMSDTHDRHGLFDDLPPCDLFIHAGDILMRGRMLPKGKAIGKLKHFNDWLASVPAKHKVVIGGNHDRLLERLGPEKVQGILTNAIYMCNTSLHILGLHIWASPLSAGTSANDAFQSDEFLAAAENAASEIVNNGQPVDILITHSPFGSLADAIQPRIMHVAGHVHAHHGVRASRRKNKDGEAHPRQWYKVAAPIMDKGYQPTQLPVVVDLDLNAITAGL